MNRMINIYNRAAVKARANMGFGPQVMPDGHYRELWSAVLDHMGEFVEGDEHMDTFMEEAQSQLDQSEANSKKLAGHVKQNGHYMVWIRETREIVDAGDFENVFDAEYYIFDKHGVLPIIEMARI